jgi:hypothetical protein
MGKEGLSSGMWRHIVSPASDAPNEEAAHCFEAMVTTRLHCATSQKTSLPFLVEGGWIWLSVRYECVSIHQTAPFLGLYYSGRQSQQFYIFILLTHYMFRPYGPSSSEYYYSYEASYAFLTDPLLRLSLHIYHLLSNNYYVLVSLYVH